jgi:hypothetical protein
LHIGEYEKAWRNPNRSLFGLENQVERWIKMKIDKMKPDKMKIDVLSD